MIEHAVPNNRGKRSSRRSPRPSLRAGACPALRAMVFVGGTGAMNAYWWMRRIEKEAATARSWRESYGPRINPQPPSEPRCAARRQPDEVQYWNHHNQPRAWAVSQLGRSSQEERYAIDGHRANRSAADGSPRTMGFPVRPHSPPVDPRRPLAATASERAARRESAAAVLAAEAASASPIGDGAPLFKSAYASHHENPRLEGSPLPGGLPVLQQLSPRNQMTAGHLPSGEARWQYPRDKDSQYRETCISHRHIGYKGINGDGGSYINYRAGGSIAPWLPPKPNDRFG